MKIHPMGTELFHADGQTVITKLVVAFRNFVNAPKNDHMFRLCFLIIIRSYNTYITILVRVTRSHLHKHIHLSKFQYFTLSILM